MNLVEKYIRECDCLEIQDLKKQLEYCDEVAVKENDSEYKDLTYFAFSKAINNKYLFSHGWDNTAMIYPRNRVVWMPSLWELDRELGESVGYSFGDARVSYYENITKMDMEGQLYYVAVFKDSHDMHICSGGGYSPFLARIQLLKIIIKRER